MKKGQQEIAGFVIIVVLVVVAMMIFMVISLKQTPTQMESRTAENALSSILSFTTECIVSPPHQQSIRDLIRSCFENEKCDNLGISSCTYLNDSLSSILPRVLLETKNTIKAYDFIVTWEDETGTELPRDQLKLYGGKCNQTNSLVTGANEQINLNTGYMKVRLNICSEV